MSNRFDVWLTTANVVYRNVPASVVADWRLQGRIGSADRTRIAGTTAWSEPIVIAQTSPTSTPTLADEEDPFSHSPTVEEDDDDADMIPLIDISLVLLIFFMMTTTVSAIARIAVPTAKHAEADVGKPTILWAEIDRADGGETYALRIGRAGVSPENDRLPNADALLGRIDTLTAEMKPPPEVRLAAHGDVPFGTIERLLQGLDRRRQAGKIGVVRVDVSEGRP